jgi:hypothetical protein
MLFFSNTCGSDIPSTYSKQMNKAIKNATIESVQRGKLLSIHFLLNVISNIPFLYVDLAVSMSMLYGITEVR